MTALASRYTILRAGTIILCTNAYSQTWIPVFTGYSYSGGQETRFVDGTSVRVLDDNITYQFRMVKGDRVTLERTAWANCPSATRFEVVYPSDVRDKPFKSTYPGTSIGAEVDKACELAHQTTGRAGTPPPVASPQPLPQIPTPPPPRASKPTTSTGSGFAVQSNYVITNHHVIEGCREVSVRQGRLISQVELVAEYQGADLALLRTESRLSSWAQIRRAAVLGEPVTVAGHPLTGILATDVIVTSGQVNSLAGLRNDPTLLQISAPVQPGNSGGPLVDRSGSVVGVVVSKLNVERLSKLTGDYAQNINFAIKPEVLRLFLDANQISYKGVDLGKPIDGIQVAELARAYTVQVICTK